MTRRSRGLTLVELIVTMALVSMLLSASLGLVTRLMGRHRKALTQNRYETTRNRLGRLLEIDVRHAWRCRVVSNGLELRTKSTLADETMEVRLIPATVVYETVTIDGVPWLVRTQRIGQSPPGRELVCSGVEKILFYGPRQRTGDLYAELKPGDVILFKAKYCDKIFKENKNSKEKDQQKMMEFRISII